MSLSWIDEYIEGVIEYCHSNDIYEIYDTLNIKIKRIDKDHKLLQGSDALYVRDYFDVEIVFIRDDLPYKYEKYVLSHELGHAILHTEIIKAAYNRGLISKGKLEKQADYFACMLLDIKADDVYHYELTSEQIATDLCISESSLEFIEIYNM